KFENFEKFEKFEKFENFENFENRTFTFGIFEADIDGVINVTALALNSSWNKTVLEENDPRLFNRNKTLSLKKKIKTHYIFCTFKFAIHLVVLIDRKSYFYGGKFEFESSRLSVCGHLKFDKLKFPFAIDKFIIEPIQQINGSQIKVYHPSMVDLFI